MSCRSIDKTYTDFSLVRYKKASKDYKYDEHPLFEFNGEYYVHQDSLTYQRSELKHAIIFKADGIVSYTRNELLKDTMLVNLLGLEFRKEIHIQQNQLRDGEMTIQCKKRKKGEFICLKREYLYKYEIKR